MDIIMVQESMRNMEHMEDMVIMAYMANMVKAKAAHIIQKNN